MHSHFPSPHLCSNERLKMRHVPLLRSSCCLEPCPRQYIPQSTHAGPDYSQWDDTSFSTLLGIISCNNSAFIYLLAAPHRLADHPATCASSSYTSTLPGDQLKQIVVQ
uniref:Uncharacterized protein n=1 Tax=Leptocylindrus danicus TaxID=163516 RepID=A0A7S2P0P0_9STRA|mmetsp:Transcript_19535/g.29066  ORF Transcript_19535/g.29066 Transcript_19535/m.29066 type:complete len:108 (+) Transcript_19535:19-342(+)